MQPTAGFADPRVRRYITPVRVVWQSDESSVGSAQCLLDPRPPQAVFTHQANCVLRNDGTEPGIVLDFGSELNGGIALTVHTISRLDGRTAMPLARVRIRLGESVAEVMGQTNNDHAVHDMVVPVSLLGCHEYGNTGMRFARIDLIESDCRLELRAVHAVAIERPLERIGSFWCSDERISRVWDVGARTVELCMQTYLWDGIKRDRLVWVGDMHPETMVIDAVFGPHPIVPASLDLVRDHTPLGEWMNGISSYSIWWVLVQHSHFLHGGDVGYLVAQRDYLLGLLDQLIACVGPDGVERMPAWRFLDWPSSGDEAAIHAGLHALLSMGLDRGARLARALGNSAVADRCVAAYAKMRSHVPPAGQSKQAAALLALSGLVSAEQANREVLAVQPLQGVSTFYGYYMLEARALAGDVSGGLELIRRFWGAMLDMGATSFWEDFSLDWLGPDVVGIDQLVKPNQRSIHADFGAHCYKGLRHSLCHGWAAGPTAWLSRHVLGVRPLESGCRTVRVRPALGNLQWVEGAVPTPAGPVRVKAKRDASNEVKCEVDAPSGVRVLTGQEAAQADANTFSGPAWF